VWHPLDAPHVVRENRAVTTGLQPLDQARSAFQAGSWQEAFDALSELDAASPLGAEDLEALGECAWWLSRREECIAARERAVAVHLEAGRPRQAALVALKLCFFFLFRGEAAIASGWFGKAKRLLGDQPEGVEHGHLLRAEAAMAQAQGDLGAALEKARRAQELGRRYEEANLVALGQYTEGCALLKQGRVSEGMALLDEAMLAAVGGELLPMSTAEIYCKLIDACQELGHLRRASEWTEALRRWSETHAVSVFPGVCRVHRAEVMHLRGAWTEAEEEARRACGELLHMSPAFAAEGFYEVGEIRRRTGDLAGADQAFRQASELGREPQPGLALVRLAQGKVDAAAAGVRRALAE
jgi:tetratricopeptide (TPR) repeat protein